MSDAFPSTAQAWIEAQLERGEPGRAEVNRHIMETYSTPLSVYYAGGWRARFGEPRDVVTGFFADRLARDDFLHQWLRSGLRLRVWLRNAFSFYMKELRRGVRRNAQVLRLADGYDTEGQGPAPEALLERAFARSIVQRALLATRDECLDQGSTLHWEIFHQHHLQERSYPDIAAEVGITAAQAAVLVRLVVRRFRSALRQQLIRDGVQPENVDREIQDLMGRDLDEREEPLGAP